MGLLGIDVGTTGCKATVIDFQGNVKGQAYKEYNIISPREGWQEIDPNIVWDSVKETIKIATTKTAEAIGAKAADTMISAISVSSLGEAAIPLDKEGKVLYNSFLYIDSRGMHEAGLLQDAIGFDKIYSITGCNVHSMFTISKIMWVKKHMKEVYDKTWKYLFYADYILFRLGAVPHSDYSLAARSMAFDIINKKWSDKMLDAAGVSADKFAEPVQAGTVVGRMSNELAAELGLNKGVMLVAGGHDQSCAALGSGAVRDSVAADGAGTVECLTPSFDKPVLSEAMGRNSFVCVPHVIRDMYVTYAFNFTSGSILKWFRNEFGHAETHEAKRKGSDVYDVLLGKATGHPTNLFLIPHFAGAATPYMDVNAKGALIGLEIGTKREDVIKALLEGLNYEMMVNASLLEEAGVPINELRVVGGLAKSETYLKLKADMMGKKVVSLNVSEAGTLGVAILAGTACGAFESIDTAVDSLVKIKKEYYPDKMLHEEYCERFEKYKRVYHALKEIYK